MRTIGSTLVLALALGVSGCILLLDTEKLHSDSGGAAGASAAGAGGASAGASGAAGDAGKAGKGGKGPGGSGGMSAGGAGGGAGGGANPACLMCLANKCAKEVGVCELKPMCKACLADGTKAGCAMDADYLAVVGCLCLSCAVDCAVNCGSAGKGGGLQAINASRRGPGPARNRGRRPRRRSRSGGCLGGRRGVGAAAADRP